MTNKIKPLPIPAIHSNGSGPGLLKMQAKEVYLRLHNALDAMRLAKPHGRDYYTINDSAFNEAHEAHNALETQIQAIADAYRDYAIAITKVAKGE